MIEFKAGDRVVILNSIYFADELQAGKEGVVESVDVQEGDMTVVRIRLDSGYGDPLATEEEGFPPDVWPFYSNWLEHVK